MLEIKLHPTAARQFFVEENITVTYALQTAYCRTL
ncbi:Uncharacterised protein [Vibrio cholerae]|nr:Uncharacterised protein [Vibrio cholerae]CSH97764.1 Uncharacterised protein [Vibrio cholerae]